MSDQPLADFIEQVTGTSHLRVEADLGDGFVRLLSSEAERRQAQHDIRSTEDIVIEMLRNSRDAGAQMIFIATARDGDDRIVTVIDDGQGIPEGLHEAIFEPRVTSKLDTYHMDRWGVHGRGMALYSIRANCREASVVCSEPGKGAAIRVVADACRLSEKADQSSLPRIVQDEDGRTVMRGPRNINRMVAEFVMEERDSCPVFLGSPNEILATMIQAGNRVIDLRERTFAKDISAYPVCLRPALAVDPAELADIAAGLGMDISERSARRILDGRIAALPPFLATLMPAQSAQTDVSASRPSRRDAADNARVDPRGLKIAEDDLRAFSSGVSQVWRDLAQAYYLDPDVEPQVRVGRDGIRITIPAIKQR